MSASAEMSGTRSIGSRVSRAGATVLAEQLAAAVVGIAGSALALRRLGPASFGVFSVALGLVQISTLSTTNIESALPRLIPEYKLTNREATAVRLLAAMVGLKLLAGFIMGAIWFVIAPPIARMFVRTPGLEAPIRALALLPFALSMSDSAIAFWFGHERFRARAVLTVAINSATLVAAVFVGATRSPARYAVGYVGWTILVAALGVAGLFIRNRGVRDPDIPLVPEVRRAWRYAWPLSLSQGLFLAYQNIGRVIFGAFFNPVITGQLAFAMSTVERLTGLAASLPNALLPALSTLQVQRKIAALGWLLRRALRFAGIAGLGILALLVGFGHWITLILGGPAFLPAVAYLQILAFQGVFRLPSQPLGAVLQVNENTKGVLIVNAVKFAFEIAAFLVLIPLFGPSGACVAVIISYLIALVHSEHLLRRHLPDAIMRAARADLIRVYAAASVIALGVALVHWFVPASAVLFGVAAAAFFLCVASVVAAGLVRGRDLRYISARLAKA